MLFMVSPMGLVGMRCTVFLHGMFTICLHTVEHISITLPAANIHSMHILSISAANTFHADLVTLICSSLNDISWAAGGASS